MAGVYILHSSRVGVLHGARGGRGYVVHVGSHSRTACRAHARSIDFSWMSLQGLQGGADFGKRHKNKSVYRGVFSSWRASSICASWTLFSSQRYSNAGGKRDNTGEVGQEQEKTMAMACALRPLVGIQSRCHLSHPPHGRDRHPTQRHLLSLLFFLPPTAISLTDTAVDCVANLHERVCMPVASRTCSRISMPPARTILPS